MRRGLTLIEVLVSVALLSALMTVAASWLRLAGHATSELGQGAAWRSAAAATLARIAEDLACGNVAEPDRVEFNGVTLTIRTRDRGPALSAYSLAGSTLVRRCSRGSETGTGSDESPRVLVGDVARFEAVLERTDRGDVLLVRIAAVDGGEAWRRFKAP